MPQARDPRPWCDTDFGRADVNPDEAVESHTPLSRSLPQDISFPSSSSREAPAPRPDDAPPETEPSLAGSKRKRGAMSISKSFHLEHHLRREYARSTPHDMVCLESEVEAGFKEKLASSAENTKVLVTFKILFFGLGNSETLVSFQAVLNAERRYQANNRLGTPARLTMEQRFYAIEHTSDNIAREVFHRRVNIYELSRDARGDSSRTASGFIINTPQAMSTVTVRRSGNPLNLDGNGFSEKIMAQLFPTLMPGSDDYKSKRHYVDKIRRLGERLELLVEKFGIGILGLLPLPGDDLIETPHLSFSDNL
jgi:hypothetical protein